MAMHVAVVGCPRPFVSSWREMDRDADSLPIRSASAAGSFLGVALGQFPMCPSKCRCRAAGRPAHAFCPLKRSVGSRGNATPVAARTLVRRPRVASAPVKNESTVSEVELEQLHVHT
jgi:hypothetical protein